MLRFVSIAVLLLIPAFGQDLFVTEMDAAIRSPAGMWKRRSTWRQPSNRPPRSPFSVATYSWF